MPETHINAYYMDVDEKKAAVDKAKADLEAAEVALKTKQAQVDAQEKAEAPVESKPRKVTRSAKNSKFVNKTEAQKSPNTTVTETVDDRIRKSPKQKVVLQGTARNASFTK